MKFPTSNVLLGVAIAFTCVSLASPLLGQTGRRDPKRIFAGFKRKHDKDLDGRVSRDEFTGRKKSWRRLDVDGDGWITLADVEARYKIEEEAKEEAASTVGTPSLATSEQIEFFETKVRPVLANECFSCHAANGRTKGDLSLDSITGFLTGGASGPALVPGDPDASLFIEAIRYEDPGFSMPPKNKLSADEVRDLETWVRMGAPWPDEGQPEMVEMSPVMMDAADGEIGGDAASSLNRDIDMDAGREFWSFRPVNRPDVPDVADDAWAKGAIDRFLLETMEQDGVEPVADASDRTWLRRVTVDLTGLPPTLDEIEQFEADDSPERDAHVVDRLLASDAYAERWGRHWLDVARFGETSGKERNVAYPFAWRYRDWVLKAFREDMPYNEFLQTQIAGDLLPAADEDEVAWNQIATGYLALGSKGHANRDKIRFQLDMVDEQIDAMSQGMLGLTLSCARCHDHKFDPIPTEDYYGIAGIFLSTETHFGTAKGRGNNQTSELIELPAGANVPNGPTIPSSVLNVMRRAADKLEEQLDEEAVSEEMEKMDEVEMDAKGSAEAEKAAADERRRRGRSELLDVYNDLFARFDDEGRATDKNRLAMGVSEGEPRDISVLERGELDRPSGVTPRAIPEVFRTGELEPITEGSGRAELATWLASDENPLTARVWVNRIWLHLFGAGLVSTPDNFGAGGNVPSHPELLDWLAAELMENGWSTKSLIREVALSRAYRLDSTGSASNELIDPDVELIWRMPERRMESEAIRDAMLSVAGTLSREPAVGSALGALDGSISSNAMLSRLLREQPVRSVYLPVPRGAVVETLEAFDAPDPEFVTGQRDETTVATQALFLMNDFEVLRLADAFADRLLRMGGSDDTRIIAAFELAYGREPSREERRTVQHFLRDYTRMAFDELKSTEPQKDLSRRQRRRLQAKAERDRRRALRQASEPGSAPPAFVDPERAAWSAFAQSLFQSAEFRAIG